jgi:hypothetical protein
MEVSRTEREALSGWVEDSNYGIGSPKLLEHLNVGNTMVWRVLPVPDGAGPDTDGAYTIRIPYWGYTGFPATDSWLTLNAEQYLVKQATAEAFFLAWDAVKGALWQQLADKEAAEVIKTDKKERLSHIGEIVHSRGVRAVKLRI